jgi:hypothetical protein
MRRLTSPQAIKTCWIAEVKEELGRHHRGPAANRLSRAERKVRAPAPLKPIIRQAILDLEAWQDRPPTYREIQQEVLRRLTGHLSAITAKTWHAIRLRPRDLVHLAKDKDLLYG